MTPIRQCCRVLRPGWHLMIVLAAMILLGISGTAYPDTYNFFFQKPKKAEKKAPAAEESGDEETAPDGDEEEPKKAPEPKVDQVSTKGKDPVIINNYNYNTNDNHPKVEISPPVTPAPETAIETTAPATSASAMTVAPRHSSDDGDYPWHLGVGAIFIPDDKKYPSKRGAGGFELSVQYFLAKPLAVSVYGGIRGRGSDESLGEFALHAGFETEYIPIRIAATENWDTLQLGLLLGGVTHSAARGNIGSLYLGARATLNLNQRFGITAAARGNLGMAILQAGFVTVL